MTYAFARIGAVVSMRVEDYFGNGKRWWVRLHEKGGKGGEPKSPLFRSARGKTVFSKLARSVLRHIRVASKQELKDRIMAATWSSLLSG